MKKLLFVLALAVCAIGQTLQFPTQSTNVNGIPGVCTPPAFFYMNGSYYQCNPNGSGYIAIGGGYTPFSNFAALVNSGWSWFNQGSSTINFSGGIASLTATGTGGDNVHGYIKSLPGSAPWTVTAAMLPQMGLGGASVGNVPGGFSGGICLYDGTKLKAFFLGRPPSSPFAGDLEVDNFNSVTSFNAALTDKPLVTQSPIVWLKIHNDGTNFTYYYSIDPTNVGWTLFYTEATNSFLTPTSAGFCIDLWNSTLNTLTLTSDVLVSWSVQNI